MFAIKWNFITVRQWWRWRWPRKKNDSSQQKCLFNTYFGVFTMEYQPLMMDFVPFSGGELFCLLPLKVYRLYPWLNLIEFQMLIYIVSILSYEFTFWFQNFVVLIKYQFSIFPIQTRTAILQKSGMIERKSGRIVFISSIAGKVPIPYRSSFAASKHALQAFSDSLRAEVALHNVKVLVSSPEYIANDLTQAEVKSAGSNQEGMWNL